MRVTNRLLTGMILQEQDATFLQRFGVAFLSALLVFNFWASPSEAEELPNVTWWDGFQRGQKD